MRITSLIIFFIPLTAFSQLQLSKFFSDNLVLQRNHPVFFMGKANPGKKITVTFAGQTRVTGAKSDSSWSVSIPAQKENPHAQSLIVSSGNEKIVLQNILIGDVWLCIGQSNMEWPMAREMHFADEIKNSQQPQLRFYNPTYAGKNIFGTRFTDSVAQRLTPENFYTGQWQQCDSTSFKTMSAVAYYFGKELFQNINVPVGLINLSIGGAPLETFIDKTVLKSSRSFSAKINGDWIANNTLPVWIRERGKQNTEDVKNISVDENGSNHGYKPGFAYSAGIEPLLSMSIKGILCYQGESNAQESERVNEYAALSRLLVDDYRKKWKQLQLPFYFVQLSSIDTARYNSHLWPQFRDEQRKMLQLIPYSGMAVCSDIGAKDDVHPTDKKNVGERLARWALYKTYKQNIIPSGPLPLKATYANGKLIISFKYIVKGLKTSDGKTLRGFSVDGKNEAEAVIADRRIIIPVNTKPEYIYYGWKSLAMVIL